MKKMIILKEKIPKDILEKYAILVLTLGHFEWVLQEFLIFLILETNFDQNKKNHVVLANYICELSFDRKIKLSEKFGILTKEMEEKISVIKKRRNIFIHGIGKNKNELFLEIIHKKQRENLNAENLSSFLEFIEKTGGELVNYFESRGFKISQD